MEVRVHVRAGARKDSLEMRNGVCEIFVRARAERGEANDRVREIIAEHFGVSVASVRIQTGHARPMKRVLVDA